MLVPARTISRSSKLALVVGGYLLAIGAGALAGRAYDMRVSALPYDTSGGMYAGGEALASLGAFLVVALATTVLALWFARRNGTLWRAVALGALAFAGVGLLAVLMALVVHGPPRNLFTTAFSLLGLAQLLGVPLWTGGMVLLALIAPAGSPRRLLIAAIGLQLVIGVCAGIHWLVPRPPL